MSQAAGISTATAGSGFDIRIATIPPVIDAAEDSNERFVHHRLQACGGPSLYREIGPGNRTIPLSQGTAGEYDGSQPERASAPLFVSIVMAVYRPAASALAINLRPTIPALMRLMSRQATFEPVSAKTQPVSGHTQIPDIENSCSRDLSRKTPRSVGSARFSSPKTRPLPANPRECRRFSHTWKSHRRDRAGWLTTQS